ncbi:MAG TPA: hypothetical protein VMB80_12570 [Candidatus Acidoferrum sp.]|nr:hypothetical protein [Candidatus Acidoferrum sp.]
MNETPAPDSGRPSLSGRFFRWLIRRRTQKRALIGLAIFATLVAIFYTEENWRGQHAWERCKADLEAKGAVLDWDNYIPPPVPDDQNFYTASTNIAVRFVKAQTEAQNEAASHLQWLRLGSIDPVMIAEVTVVSSNSDVVPNGADLYLRYDHSVVTVATSHKDFSEEPSPVLPTIELKDVPLKEALEQLSRQANLNYTSSSEIQWVDSKGKPILVTIRWENVSAREALYALLENYDLALVEDSKTGTARIVPTKGGIYMEPAAKKEMSLVLSRILDSDTNGFSGVILQGATGISFVANPPPSSRPAHIVVWANKTPGVQEMSEMFLKNTAKTMGTNSFQIYGNPRVIAAADYLAWSDQYVPAFDEVREALKRPYAMIPGNYARPFEQPIPNFVMMRSLAQTLAQRAQCYLLLNQPEPALRELTLMHDACRILEKPPTGKPETLVEAMINVAISGLYVATLQEGFRLREWQEPQLAALQVQLAGINLPPWVAAAFQAEQAAICHTAELVPLSKIWQIIPIAKQKTLWQRIQELPDHLVDLAPRGWIYQNMAVSARLIQIQRESVLDENQNVSPKRNEKAAREIAGVLEKNHSPFYLLARIAIPNSTKAMQTTAFNQTLVNQAQIACALERYRLAHGEYPESLAALMPQFIEKIPTDVIGGQPLHYRRTGDGKFLLYSIGWNETDDGGQASEDRGKGDWVWKN